MSTKVQTYRLALKKDRLLTVSDATANASNAIARIVHAMLEDAPVEHMVGVFKIFAGPGFPFDEDWTRKIMAASYDRSFYPPGMARQLIAILAHGNRKPALTSVNVPTLVIHGTGDPLVPVEGGKDTANTIAGARLMLIEGMGHDLPHGGAWPQIIEAIAEFTLKIQY